jgi:stage III sporulation protein SpoIIIAA
VAIRDLPGWLKTLLVGLPFVVGATGWISNVANNAAAARSDLADVKATVKEHEKTIESTKDGITWLKSAMRTGKDPDTGVSFPWAK